MENVGGDGSAAAAAEGDSTGNRAISSRGSATITTTEEGHVVDGDRVVAVIGSSEPVAGDIGRGVVVETGDGSMIDLDRLGAGRLVQSGAENEVRYGLGVQTQDKRARGTVAQWKLVAKGVRDDLHHPR